MDNKIDVTQAGLSLHYRSAWHPCERVTASLFLGSDDHPNAYCAVSAKIPRIYLRKTKQWVDDPEYHVFNEVSGRLSEEFIEELRQFMNDNRVERLILVCSDEEMRNRIRKQLGVRVIFEDEKRRNHNSIILREWFARTKNNGEGSQLKVWGRCSEAIKANYPPARDCMVRLLEYYDKSKGAKTYVPSPKLRAGYH